MQRTCAHDRRGSPGSRSCRKILQVAAAGIVLLAAGPTAASGQSCLKPDERASLEVRALQTKLMVGALACDAHNDYNAFVVRFRPELARHNRTMTGFFERSFGRASERESTKYVTRLANLSSLASQLNPSQFCDETIATMRAANSVSPRDFDAFTLARRPQNAAVEFQSCSVAQR
jgi:hypothetical protein